MSLIGDPSDTAGGTYVIYAGQSQTPVFLNGQPAIRPASEDHVCIDGSHHTGIDHVGFSGSYSRKVLKVIPHFTCHPGDLKFIPLSIFSYLHGFINIYALVALHVTVWGSQNLDELKTSMLRRRRRRYICLKDSTVWAGPLSGADYTYDYIFRMAILVHF